MFYVKLSSFLGIYTGTLSCIVKLPDVGGNETTLQLKKFPEVLLTGLSFTLGVIGA